MHIISVHLITKARLSLTHSLHCPMLSGAGKHECRCAGMSAANVGASYYYYIFISVCPCVGVCIHLIAHYRENCFINFYAISSKDVLCQWLDQVWRWWPWVTVTWKKKSIKEIYRIDCHKIRYAIFELNSCHLIWYIISLPNMTAFTSHIE